MLEFWHNGNKTTSPSFLYSIIPTFPPQFLHYFQQCQGISGRGKEMSRAKR